jgi:hypothetical protein
MPIRAKNLDMKSDQVKLRAQVLYGDVSASTTVVKPIFAAPYACVIEAIDIYSKQVVSANSSETVKLTARFGTNSDTVIAIRAAATSGVHSNTISANSMYRLYPSGNNSLTAGQVVDLMVSAVCASISAVLVCVTYTPLKHRESR